MAHAANLAFLLAVLEGGDVVSSCLPLFELPAIGSGARLATASVPVVGCLSLSETEVDGRVLSFLVPNSPPAVRLVSPTLCPLASLPAMGFLTVGLGLGFAPFPRATESGLGLFTTEAGCVWHSNLEAFSPAPEPLARRSRRSGTFLEQPAVGSGSGEFESAAGRSLSATGHGSKWLLVPVVGSLLTFRPCLLSSCLVDPAALSVFRALSRAALSLSVKDFGSRLLSRRINRIALRLRLRSAVSIVLSVSSLVLSALDNGGAKPNPRPPALTTVAKLHLLEFPLSAGLLSPGCAGAGSLPSQE